MSKTYHPAVSAVVQGMTNWERSRWLNAGCPGALDKEDTEVKAFLASLPPRFTLHSFRVSTNGKVKLVDALRGRTGMTITEFSDESAVVRATNRMVERLVASHPRALSYEVL